MARLTETAEREIAQWLQCEHRNGERIVRTPSMLTAWYVDAERQHDDGNGPVMLEIDAFHGADGCPSTFILMSTHFEG